MAHSVEQFAKAVLAAGLSSAEEIKAVWNELPANQRPKNGESFAKVLIEREKLTSFQAQELLGGGATPLVLGDYVLLEKIGAGGMGQVFKAQHRHMDRLAAIKLLPAALTNDEAAVKRFQREAKAAAKLSHPNIVQAFDASVQRGVWYLVMEYVEGRDLSGVVAAEGPLAIPRAVDFIRQAARGLAFAHENGVVHRDIKPANLLLDKKGVIKILDMGLARIENAAKATAQEGLTQSGQVMGTVDYMAPEQAFDTKSADGRADVYSLGCTLYRLLTGQNMYEGETLVQKLMAHQAKPIPALAAARPEVPAALVAVFERMVAKRPEDRYQSLTDVDLDLGAIFQPAAPPSSANNPFPPESGLNSFRGSMGGGPLPAASVAGPKMKNAPTKGPAELAQTLNLSSPQHATDPVSERSIEVARELTSSFSARPKSAAKHKPKPPLWKQPPVLIAAGLGGVLLLALGIWAIVGNKGGQEVGKIQVPNGGSAKVKPAAGNTAKPNRQEPFNPPPAALPPEVGSKFALRFEGGMGVETGDVPLLPSTVVTLEAWLTSESFTNFYNSAASIVEMNEEQSLKKSKADYAFYTFHGGANLANGVELKRRIHLAGVNDGKQRRLYLNGKLVGHSDDAGQLHPDRKPGKLMIGRIFLGTIDAVRISTVPRYTQDFTPPATLVADKDTFALYKFDQGQGDVLEDSSGNNYHGKIKEAKWVRLDGTALVPGGAVDFALERKVAQWLLEQRVPFGIDNKMQFPGDDQLPAQPFTIYDLHSSFTLANLPREELLARLKEIRLLGRFSGGYLPFQDADLWAEAFADIPTVTQVNAYGCDITDQGVKVLSRRTGLKYLNFDSCPNVTAAGLAALADCPSLETLELDPNAFRAGKYTLADLQKLQHALPKCRIVFSGLRPIPGLKPATPNGP